MKRFVSKAEWPPHVFTAADGSHVSEDEHDTPEEADAVCEGLKRNGFGGKGPKPIQVWFEDRWITGVGDD